MHAIEFEAVSKHHTIRIPDEVPDNVNLRVLLLLDSPLLNKPAAPIPVVETAYETFAVDHIIMPTRDQRYDR